MENKPIEIVGTTSQEEMSKHNIQYPYKEMCKSYTISLVNNNLKIGEVLKVFVEPKISEWQYIFTQEEYKIFIEGSINIRILFSENSYDDNIYSTEVNKIISGLLPVDVNFVDNLKPTLFIEEAFIAALNENKFSLSLLIGMGTILDTENQYTEIMEDYDQGINYDENVEYEDMEQVQYENMKDVEYEDMEQVQYENMKDVEYEDMEQVQYENMKDIEYENMEQVQYENMEDVEYGDMEQVQYENMKDVQYEDVQSVNVREDIIYEDSEPNMKEEHLKDEHLYEETKNINIEQQIPYEEVKDVDIEENIPYEEIRDVEIKEEVPHEEVTDEYMNKEVLNEEIKDYNLKEKEQNEEKDIIVKDEVQYENEDIRLKQQVPYEEDNDVYVEKKVPQEELKNVNVDKTKQKSSKQIEMSNISTIDLSQDLYNLKSQGINLDESNFSEVDIEKLKENSINIDMDYDMNLGEDKS